MKVNYITTPTSGSQSIYRILSEYTKENNSSLSIFRGQDIKRFDGLNEEDLFIINFRDPRDIWCNQYYWLTQHDAPNQKVMDDRKSRFDQGIDNSVLKSYNSFLNGGDLSINKILNIINTYNETKSNNILFLSYAQLCLDYNGLISNLNRFFNSDFTINNNSIISNESPEGLTKNNNWIGNKWNGCDINPGRYKKELKSETIQKINSGLGPLLDSFKSVELEHLKFLYNIED